MHAPSPSIADKHGVGPSCAWWRSLLIVVLTFCISSCTAADSAGLAGHGEARERLTEIQVLSQQIAKFAPEAASGGHEAFVELQAAKDRIQLNLDVLREGNIPAQSDKTGADGRGIAGYQNLPRMHEPLRRLLDAWYPIDRHARIILDRRELVLDASETATSFTSKLFQMQASMDEVVRSMSESGATSAQIYIAVRQIVLADRMLRYVTEILQGGAGAVSAADRLHRDVGMFGQVLDGLREGNDEQGIARVVDPRARAGLDRVGEIYAACRRTSKPSSKPPPKCSKSRKPRTGSSSVRPNCWNARAISTQPSRHCRVTASATQRIDDHRVALLEIPARRVPSRRSRMTRRHWRAFHGFRFLAGNAVAALRTARGPIEQRNSMNDVRHRFAAVGLLLVACLGMAMGLARRRSRCPDAWPFCTERRRQRVIDIQVLSQQIALFAEKAASGHGPAFAALQAARDRMQLNLDMLREGSTPALIAKVGAGERTQFSGIAGYENVPRMQEPLRRLIAAWAQVDGRVQSVLDHRELVSGLPETAGAFSAMVPQLQAQMDEVVRSMNESGAATARFTSRCGRSCCSTACRGA